MCAGAASEYTLIVTPRDVFNMNVVSGSLFFVRRVSPALALSLALVACGNKGDLYLEPVELTEEQKTLLNELGQREDNPATRDGDENTEDKDIEDEKKKKASSPETAQ